MNRVYSRAYSIIAAPKFFWFILALFLVQALWFVFSARYPMAFDEAYHFNFIRVYSEQWLPFLGEHPEGYNLNSVTREPSYFYNYLLSFPFRIITLFSESPTVQIITLRLINVGIFAYTIVLYRKIFTLTGLSHALTHVGLLLFTLIPIVPMLAAHINYDNGLMLLIAWLLLVSHSALSTLKAHQLPLQQLLIIGIVALFASIVKYAVLPILLGGVGFILLYTYLTFRSYSLRSTIALIRRSWHRIARPLKVILPIMLLIGGLLCFERFGLNLLRYHTLVPDCDQVISVEQCLEFGPYERNAGYRQTADPNFEPSPQTHIGTWLSGMWYRLFFMINGDLAADRYHNFPPLPLPALSAVAIFSFGLLSVLRRPRQIFRTKPFLGFLAAIIISYILILWYQSYAGYSSLGRISALNGRYLLLIIPAVIIIFGHAMTPIFTAKPKLKIALATLTILLFLQGGGVVSFIVRSNPNWYWPNQSVEQINVTTQKALQPLIFGSESRHLQFVPR
ncbi:MAG: hypothetical protein WD467_03525 [Candidatus Saccharimonadales bacterium]